MAPRFASSAAGASYTVGTLASLCRRQFDAIAEGLQLPQHRTQHVHRFLDDLFPVLGTDARSIAATPRWSAIGDDASPFEWSIVLGSATDVRLLVEAQSDPASPHTYWQSATALTQWCAEQLSSEIGRLQRLVDLYEPTDSQAYFACWHGFEFPDIRADPLRPPRVKIYLNPAAQGRNGARDVINQTLTRLGFVAARDALADVFASFVPVHCSIDLRDGPNARVKLYLRVFDRTQMEFLYRSGASAAPGDIERLCRSLGLPARWRRPGYCVLHYVDAKDAIPTRTVVNLPVRDLLGDDESTADVLSAWLADEGLDPRPYRAVLTSLRRLDAPASASRSTGRHSYVSFQRDAGKSRVTLYFGAKAFAARHGWVSMDPLRTWPTPIAAGSTRDT